MKILFCSSGKTYGHFFKTHMLYEALETKYDCIEMVNPTKYTLPFLSKDKNNIRLSEDLYFYNNSFLEKYDSLCENIARISETIKNVKPDVVVGDKLPNLMTACFMLNIPYISVTHASQISHNLQNFQNPNLELFDKFWRDNNLVKPVDDKSWFFYRNWGNVIAFADENNPESGELDKLGYKYSFIGQIPVVLGDPADHLANIYKKFVDGNFKSISMFTMSSYASSESDDFLISLAIKHKNVLFIYPRDDREYLNAQLGKKSVENIYCVDMIDYRLAKQLCRLFICLPGNGTLQALVDFAYPIVGVYVHSEQMNNAENYGKEGFVYAKLNENAFDLCMSKLNSISEIKKEEFESIVSPITGEGILTVEFEKLLLLSTKI